MVSSIFGLPVATLKEQSKAGRVKKVLFDLDKGLLRGFMIKVSWFEKPYYLALEDVLAIDKAALITKTKEDIVPIEEVVRAHEIYKKGFKLLGLPVKTESNENIGRLVDLSIAFETGQILSLFTKSLFTNRIIDRSKVIKITNKAVIIDDDFSKAANETVPEAEMI